MVRDIMKRNGQRRSVYRRDVLRGIGAVSVGGMLGIAGCTTEQDDGGGGNGGDTDQPDTLIIIGYPESGVQLFKDYYSDYGTDTPILVTDGLNDEALPDNVGQQLENVRGTAPAAAGPGNDFFTTRFNEEYGGDPGVFTAHAYDATAVLLLASLAAGADDGPAIRDDLRSVANPDGPELGPQDLGEAVETAATGQQLNYTGASSSVNFDENGDMGAVSYDIFSYGSDGITVDDTVPFEEEDVESGGEPSGAGSDSGRTVRLGALMALTGDLASVGQPIRDGAVLPQAQLQGNIDYTIDINVADSQTDPQAGISAANTLINGGYPAIVGPLSSGVNMNVSQQSYIPNGIVGCSPSSTSPDVTGLDDDDFVFRTAPSDVLQGEVLARVAADDVSATTAATMYVNNAYGQALSDSFASAFEDAGGSVVAQVAFEKGQTSYSSKLRSAMNP